MKNKLVEFNIFLKVFQGFHFSSPPAPRHQTGFQLGQDNRIKGPWSTLKHRGVICKNFRRWGGGEIKKL